MNQPVSLFQEVFWETASEMPTGQAFMDASPPPMPPGPGSRQKSSNTLWWLLGGGGCLLLLAALGVLTAMAWFIPWSTAKVAKNVGQRADFLAQSRDLAFASPELQEALGVPMTHEPAKTSGMSTINDDQEAWFEMDIQGPKEKATLKARAAKRKTEKAWTYSLFEAVLEDGRKLDLRSP